MKQVSFNTQFRDASRSHDNACDCCGPSTDYVDTLREAIKSSPAFIKEAICNGDLAELVAAYQSKDTQHTHDALSDVINGYMTASEASVQRRRDLFGRQPVQVLADAFGVAA